MNNRSDLNYLCYETNKDFQELDRDRKATIIANQHINDTMDLALARRDMKLLLSLIPYIETGEGTLPFKYIGETHRILRVLHIIDIECKYHKKPFSLGCDNKKSLMEKYMLTLFALRRLLFHLSDDSANDAAILLRQIKPSVIAIYTILQGDLIIPDNFLYEKITETFSGIWDDSDLSTFR